MFLDYNQNAKDRTVASAYSVRPTPDARVSFPLRWDEVPDVVAEDFTLATVPGAVRGARRRRRRDRRGRRVAGRAAGAVGAPRGRGPGRRAVAAELRASRRASRRGSSRRGSASPTRSTRAAARTAGRRPRSPRNAPPRSRRATRTPGCRRSGRAPARRRPGGASRTSRSSRSRARRPRPRSTRASSAGRRATPRRRAYLEPADILATAMRGRAYAWYRLRVNLIHVPGGRAAGPGAAGSRLRPLGGLRVARPERPAGPGAARRSRRPGEPAAQGCQRTIQATGPAVDRSSLASAGSTTLTHACGPPGNETMALPSGSVVASRCGWAVEVVPAQDRGPRVDRDDPRCVRRQDREARRRDRIADRIAHGVTLEVRGKPPPARRRERGRGRLGFGRRRGADGWRHPRDRAGRRARLREARRSPGLAVATATATMPIPAASTTSAGIRGPRRRTGAGETSRAMVRRSLRRWPRRA